METQNRIPQGQNRQQWNWGFTPGSETWNGRLAMIGFISAIIIELASGQGVLHFWGLM
ncbi:MAG: chlorophyll A-B binding protein [Lyngbya sp.]|nr:chlorophyll A-B binding protein [Lyngbya sp.]